MCVLSCVCYVLLGVVVNDMQVVCFEYVVCWYFCALLSYPVLCLGSMEGYF